ncbi:hypothetical protein T4B_11027 [Trichinella pseudospiralis]|uniref:Uncharacterized protein n=1 Tax=Trichinella pseudospiralis TaxID=6337 RepID=A0A0V1IAQ0_TRIPS|nr:hypothetical protein T4B_11027 [Trichinella pseudospiralis]
MFNIYLFTFDYALLQKCSWKFCEYCINILQKCFLVSFSELQLQLGLLLRISAPEIEN